jgi:hypothetical protein
MLNGLARPCVGGIAELFGVVEVSSLAVMDTDADNLDPVVDVCVYFPSKGEKCPENYVPLQHTVTGFKADLNRSFWGRTIRVAYRRLGSVGLSSKPGGRTTTNSDKDGAFGACSFV